MTGGEWSLLSRRLPLELKLAAYVVVALFAAAPILLLYYLPSAPLNLLGELNLAWILEWTLTQAAASATLAVLLGAPVGVAAGYYGSRIAGLYRVLGLPVFMAPSVAVVLGFRWLAEQPFAPSFLARAPLGIIIVHSYYNIPLAAVLVYSSVRGVPGEVVDYLESIGVRGLKAWKLLLLPSMLRGALSAWLLAFTYSFTGLAAPLMVEGAAYKYYTLEAWIYTVFKGFPAYRLLAVALTLLQAAVLSVAALVFIKSTLKAASAELGAATRRPRGAVTRVIMDAYSLMLLIYLYLPLLGVFFMSLESSGWYTLDNYVRLVRGPLPIPPEASFQSALVNSLLYSTIAVSGALLISIPLITGERPLIRGLASIAPLIVSPVTIGVSLYLVFYTWLRDLIGDIPAVVLLVGVSHVGAALPLATRALDSALSRVPADSAGYAAMIGLKGYRLLYALARAAGPGLASAAALSAASSLGEFGSAMVLTEPSTWSLGVLTYNLYGAGRLLGVASASATMLLGLTLLVVALIARNLRDWF